MLQAKLEQEKNKLLLQRDELEAKIATLPQEDLICTRNGKYIKWFQSNGRDPIYIPKSKRSYAEQLAVKKLYKTQQKEIQQEISLLDQCLQVYDNPKHSSKLLEDSPYANLITSYFSQFPNAISCWLEEEYKHNTNYPEGLIHPTYAGNKVRSKSEVIIANALFNYNIPYRYESGIQLDDIIFYPDFTICHPKTMEIYYWEHFGMMELTSYSDKVFSKLKIYANHNIIPSINLITTYETKDYPINSSEIKETIEKYF